MVIVTRSPIRNCTQTMPKANKYLIIKINHSHAGFFAYVNFVLNQLLYAERNNLQPVVYFGPESGDGPNAFYDPRHGGNTWDYWFEAVGVLTYAELSARIDDPDDALTPGDILSLDTKQLWKLHCNEPESVFPYPHSMHAETYHLDTEWYTKQRNKAQRVVNQYIRVKPHVQAKVDTFVVDFFGAGPVLGIHMRGTDKGTAKSHPELMRVIPPEEYFSHIDEYTKTHGPCRIFVATDQAQFVGRMRERYGSRVLCYEAIRAEGIRNPFEKEDGNGYRKGEDVLIDCLLLSRCNFLLKCTSAVGEFALYFNPQLECKDLNHLQSPLSNFRQLRIRMKRWFYLKYLAMRPGIRRWHSWREKLKNVGYGLFEALRWGNSESSSLYNELSCRSGFGDRLTDLWAALTIARLREPEASVAVYWEEAGKSYAGFQADYSTKLFGIKGAKFISKRPLGSSRRKSSYSTTEMCEECILPIGSNRQQIILRSEKNWGGNCPDRLFKDLDFYKLDPRMGRDKLAETYAAVARATHPSQEVASAIPVDISERIGFHVRLTDKLVGEDTSIDMSADTWRSIEARGMQRIEACVENGLKLFICSEDREYCDRILSKVASLGGDAVVAPSIDPNNYSAGFSALVDFFALSRCKAIVQMTKYSTFSIAACLVGDVPIVNLDDEESDVSNKINIWRNVLRLGDGGLPGGNST